MKLILVGGFPELIEMCEDNDCEIAGIIDREPGRRIMGYEVIGTDADAGALFPRYGHLPLVITPDLPHVRRRLEAHYRAAGFRFATLISKKASVSRHAEIGEGAIIHQGCNVSANVRIGAFVRLNVNSNIMHDCRVEAFSTAAPNSVLLGCVEVGEETYIGANATILPNVQVGAGATVGAGAVVTRNVAPGQTVKGVPAK